ncbi:unnamed protein product [Allacma fusca]|uniref:Uncharacterized protein n=1 Tax=Allacma fusca TaxID=39272 RepID=A0A8J2KVA1_9HEXA|nr:unnamed protein product [Allacma fusca]
MDYVFVRVHDTTENRVCSSACSQPFFECGERQHKCICGTPRCIDQELVKNGVQDCQDGSDEVQKSPVISTVVGTL